MQNTHTLTKEITAMTVNIRDEDKLIINRTVESINLLSNALLIVADGKRFMTTTGNFVIGYRFSGGGYQSHTYSNFIGDLIWIGDSFIMTGMAHVVYSHPRNPNPHTDNWVIDYDSLKNKCTLTTGDHGSIVFDNARERGDISIAVSVPENKATFIIRSDVPYDNGSLKAGSHVRYQK